VRVESTAVAHPQAAAPSPAGLYARGAMERLRWRSVVLPSEHGGWGLTFEPMLLGLLVAWSWAGLAIGVAALLAFLLRTPLKLVLVDRRRHRWLPRTRLAACVAAAEVFGLVVLGLLAVAAGGWSWLVPVALALPLFAVELWFDVRSRGRRLVPELCGGVGIAAASAAIVVAGDGS
jgi:YwiC-like protein